MILLIDNYDSFTYNLYQYIEELGFSTEVFRNNQITVKDIQKMKPSAIVISPGPGTPLDAGITLDVINRLKGKTPIFGVCLGHQAIGHAFGAEVIRAPRLMHGKTSLIKHKNRGVFEGLPNPLRGMRYHSLIVSKKNLPKTLEITAEADGLIMGLRHKKFAIEGVQFHPESFASEGGKKLIYNFLSKNSKTKINPSHSEFSL
jgi:anthranilate synthase/aminodeoxychorismate synthase-like glutamine amidotransferase